MFNNLHQKNAYYTKNGRRDIVYGSNEMYRAEEYNSNVKIALYVFLAPNTCFLVSVKNGRSDIANGTNDMYFVINTILKS